MHGERESTLLRDCELYSTDQAAKFLGLQPQTLARWRTERSNAIPFRKIGRLVRYRVSDLVEFTERQRRTSTSDTRK